MCDVRGRLGVRHREGWGHSFTACGTSYLFKDFCWPVQGHKEMITHPGVVILSISTCVLSYLLAWHMSETMAKEVGQVWAPSRDVSCAGLKVQGLIFKKSFYWRCFTSTACQVTEGSWRNYNQVTVAWVPPFLWRCLQSFSPALDVPQHPSPFGCWGRSLFLAAGPTARTQLSSCALQRCSACFTF